MFQLSMGGFKLFYHPSCRRCSKAMLLHYVEYLLLNKRQVHP